MFFSKCFLIEIIVTLDKTEQLFFCSYIEFYQELLNRFWCESRVSLSCINWAISSEGSSLSTSINQKKSMPNAEVQIQVKINFLLILCIEDVAIIAINSS